MRTIRIRAVAVLAIACAAALAPPAPAQIALPEARPCADCCKLPCIEAHLWEARYRRFVYDRISKLPQITRTAYEAREADMKATSEAMRAIYTGGNTTCNWAMPENPQVAKEWVKALNYGTEWDKGQVTTIRFSLVVDTESCALTKPLAREAMPMINACGGMGEAIVAHEDVHIAECLARKRTADRAKRPMTPLTPAQNAAAEVRGYDAEIAKLEQVRREAAVRCSKESCKSNVKDFDRTARLLGTDVKELIGKGKKKQPTRSPLQRAKRGV